MSSFLGASLASPNKLFFGVFGDLAFFYDLNATGNRHKQNNLRLMLVNNGLGEEFKVYSSFAHLFGDDADPFMAARGHFAKQSKDLIKNYSQNLGFEYLSASNKEEYLSAVDRFVNPEFTDKPILFEIFTDPHDEAEALDMLSKVDISDLLPASMRIEKKTW